LGCLVEEWWFKFYWVELLLLMCVLSVFSYFGVEVVDERFYELGLFDGGMVYIYDFGLCYGGGYGWDCD